MRLAFVLTLAFWIPSASFGQDLEAFVSLYRDSVPNYGLVALKDSSGHVEVSAIGLAAKHKVMHDSSIFGIGSITKLFTATLMLHLQEQSRLDIDKTVEQYLDIPDHLHGISLRRMLQHKSCIPEVENIQALANTSLLNGDSLDYDQLILNGIPSDKMRKDSVYHYANSNYLLLRMVVEQLTDSGYLDLIKTHLLQPLGLEQDVFPLTNKLENYAHPIIGTQDLHRYKKSGLNALSSGAGNLMMNAQTLNQVVRAIFIEHQILSIKSENEMRKFSPIGENGVGLGVFQFPEYGEGFIGHSGRQISYISYVLLNPEKGVSIVVLTNNANDTTIEAIVAYLTSTIN